ncbi:MAG TPA: cupin domain-containing protein [Rhizomicrobium sp.]
MKARPPFIRNWREIEQPAAPPGATEDFGFASELSDAAGIRHLRVAHLRIPPGRRGYPPLAMDDLEIFAFVLEGAPDLWADGHLHRLREGHGVALNARTGMAHALINNSDSDVRIFTMSEPFRRNSRVTHPADPKFRADIEKMGMLWRDAPKRKLGPNGGRPGDVSGSKRGRPDYAKHWRDILDEDEGGYPNSTEKHGIDARFGRHARFSRIGIHFEVLPAGRRTSWPHAERDEDEWVYVVSGRVDNWINGHLHPMTEGDLVGYEAGTDITHVTINNGDEDALLLVGAEASRAKNQFWYPYHPHRDKETGELFWADHPKPKMGPHDGLPDALRARLPKSARKNPIAANRAAMKLEPAKSKR